MITFNEAVERIADSYNAFMAAVNAKQTDSPIEMIYSIRNVPGADMQRVYDFLYAKGLESNWNQPERITGSKTMELYMEFTKKLNNNTLIITINSTKAKL